MKRYLALLLTLLNPFFVKAQGHSFVCHYGKQLSISNPTWYIDVYNDNYVLFANDENILIYENGSFSTIPYPTELRCVHVSRYTERIYTGGVNELGYFEVLETGEHIYKSLIPQLDSITANSLGNVWHIFEYDNTVFFTTDALILKYSNNKFTVIDPHGHLDCVFMSRGTLYFSVNSSLQFVTGEFVRECYNCDILKNKMLRGLANYGSGILVLSENDGLFLYDGQRCTPFCTEVDSLLKTSMSFCIAENEDKWAIGTVKSGIAIINKHTLAVEHIDVNTSLAENTVISLAFSPDGSLWAGLNNGIDHLLLNLPISCICPQSFVGIGYDVAIENNHLLFATNRGVFRAKFKNNSYPELMPLKGLEGQAWGFCRAFGNLYLLHDKGLYKLDKDNLYNQSGIKGFWGMLQIDDSVALAATYSELYVVVLKKDETLTFIKQPLNGSFYNMVINNGDIWLHSKGKIDCVRAKYLKTDYQLCDFKYYTINEGIPNDKYYRLQVVDNNICAVSKLGVSVFDATTQRFSKVDSIAGIDCSDGLIAVSQMGDISVGLKDNLLKLNVKGKTSAYYLDNDYVSFHAMTAPPIFSGDSMVIISNINGFSLAKINGYNQSEFSSLISKVYIKDSLVWSSNYTHKKYIPLLPYDNSDIKFILVGNIEQSKFSFRLNNEAWSEPTFFRSKEFSSLAEGRYVFQVREANLNGNSYNVDSFEFVILSPWYRRWWAYMFYVLIVSTLFIWVVRTIRQHYYKKQLKIEEKNREKMQQLEKQHEIESAADKQRISELEKQKLKDDLEHKNTELADMALSLANKNDILNILKTDISEMVKDSRLAVPLKQQLNLLTTKIDSNIQNDNLMERFEMQFDLLHNNFIRKMKKLYPNLSRNDYMLCAYIRMDFSTKEIAQMLNMSVRGVESSKYRLKKKLSIESDLNDYLKCVENEG